MTPPCHYRKLSIRALETNVDNFVEKLGIAAHAVSVKRVFQIKSTPNNEFRIFGSQKIETVTAIFCFPHNVAYHADHLERIHKFLGEHSYKVPVPFTNIFDAAMTPQVKTPQSFFIPLFCMGLIENVIRFIP